MSWEILLVEEVELWLLELAETNPAEADDVVAAIDLLEEHGPTLGRPFVDRIKGSAYHNMKELRPRTSVGAEYRILFVFDPVQQAVLLVAGDKSGQWTQWYRDNLKVAEKRYAQHLEKLDARRADD
ncbi:type II toxin-antitoxin system RelE/ParE family toxin [Streptomyces barkulensis]|uniref:type II toxin-antitoxin system RelE/ParE family toxin n=1 Tax=Streptomyces barkulensis TaxID=1257026 RepID=UPI000C6DA653|nr:type II toxin-antitoxin system RelE/ParE family toxin [Streptomyces barkulensis]